MQTKRPGPGNPAWTKGGPSPNPGGRPKLVEELRKRALKAVDDKVMNAWIDELEIRERIVGHTISGHEIWQVCRGPNWVKCAELLAAYGMGKPVQPTDGKVEVTVQDVREMSTERLIAIAMGAEAAHAEH